MSVVTIKYEEEKLNAIKQYMGKKDADFESEMTEVLGKMYEKYVPQAVREYIDSRGEKLMENTIRVLKVEPNRRYVDDIICGPFFICAEGEEGEFISLTDEQIEKYSKQFAEIEQFSGQEPELEPRMTFIEF